MKNLGSRRTVPDIARTAAPRSPIFLANSSERTSSCIIDKQLNPTSLSNNNKFIKPNTINTKRNKKKLIEEEKHQTQNNGAGIKDKKKKKLATIWTRIPIVNSSSVQTRGTTTLDSLIHSIPTFPSTPNHPIPSLIIKYFLSHLHPQHRPPRQPSFSSLLSHYHLNDQLSRLYRTRHFTNC